MWFHGGFNYKNGKTVIDPFLDWVYYGFMTHPYGSKKTTRSEKGSSWRIPILTSGTPGSLTAETRHFYGDPQYLYRLPYRLPFRLEQPPTKLPENICVCNYLGYLWMPWLNLVDHHVDHHVDHSSGTYLAMAQNYGTNDPRFNDHGGSRIAPSSYWGLIILSHSHLDNPYCQPWINKPNRLFIRGPFQ